MQRFNVLTGELPVHQDRPGFVWRGQRGLPRELDLWWLGASVYDLPDGQWTYPYHYHHGIEEWLYVADGAPILREPHGCVYPDSGKLATLGGVFKHPG